MPIYEYFCAQCETKFDLLRPMSQADAAVACPKCESTDTGRAVSMFAAMSKSGNGEARTVSGTGGNSCASCSATSCATCSR